MLKRRSNRKIRKRSPQKNIVRTFSNDNHSELVLVYTDYGYGHVDLTQHGKDLEISNEIIQNLLNLLADKKDEGPKEQKEEVKEENKEV